VLVFESSWGKNPVEFRELVHDRVIPEIVIDEATLSSERSSSQRMLPETDCVFESHHVNRLGNRHLGQSPAPRGSVRQPTPTMKQDIIPDYSGIIRVEESRRLPATESLNRHYLGLVRDR